MTKKPQQKEQKEHFLDLLLKRKLLKKSEIYGKAGLG
jgi:hypothetical protein